MTIWLMPVSVLFVIFNFNTGGIRNPVVGKTPHLNDCDYPFILRLGIYDYSVIERNSLFIDVHNSS